MKEVEDLKKTKAKKILEGITIPLKGLMGVMNPPEEASESEMPTVTAIQGTSQLYPDLNLRASKFNLKNTNLIVKFNLKR